MMELLWTPDALGQSSRTSWGAIMSMACHFATIVFVDTQKEFCDYGANILEFWNH